MNYIKKKNANTFDAKLLYEVFERKPRYSSGNQFDGLPLALHKDAVPASCRFFRRACECTFYKNVCC